MCPDCDGGSDYVGSAQSDGFVDGAGNAYRKATAAEAVANDTAARGSVAGKAGFYLPADLSELAESAATAAREARADKPVVTE